MSAFRMSPLPTTKGATKIRRHPQPRLEILSRYDRPLPGTPTVPSTRSPLIFKVAPGRPTEVETPVFEIFRRTNFPKEILLRKRKKPMAVSIHPLRRKQKPRQPFQRHLNLGSIIGFSRYDTNEPGADLLFRENPPM